ncbi:MAG: methyltransferase domain-containing protein [archaeon]
MVGELAFWKQYARAYEDIIGNYSSHKALVDEHLRGLRGYRAVLESGSGPGHLTKRLLDAGHHVYAMDVSSEMLRLLRERCGNNPNLSIECGDANELPYGDGQFDAVSSMLVFWAMKEPRKYLLEHNRVLRTGGRLVLSGPGPETRESVDLQLKTLKGDLESQGLFPELQASWESFLEYTAKNVNHTAERWFSHRDITKLLEGTGFRVDSIERNPVYCNQGHIVTATKI